MNVELTITNQGGVRICDRERYALAELMKTFSLDEKIAVAKMLADGGHAYFGRNGSIFRIDPVHDGIFIELPQSSYSAPDEG